jgi:hypothetical protein
MLSGYNPVSRGAFWVMDRNNGDALEIMECPMSWNSDESQSSRLPPKPKRTVFEHLGVYQRDTGIQVGTMKNPDFDIRITVNQTMNKNGTPRQTSITTEVTPVGEAREFSPEELAILNQAGGGNGLRDKLIQSLAPMAPEQISMKMHEMGL